ncbi:MAG: hypothetical protein K6A91_05150 [Clostridia bacterium]|nr:hypothetical protein [Clostridia bacterium]
MILLKYRYRCGIIDAVQNGFGGAMSEEGFYNQETPQRPEHNIAPEHNTLPEYNPVYPDVTFFKESSVTTREENIFQGEPPAGEARRVWREKKRKERERYSLLQRLLGLASRGGAAVLAAVVVVSAVSFAQDGDNAGTIRKAVRSAQRPAFTQQTGYDPDALLRLWQRDPDAPHKYDTEHPVVYRAATCTQDGEEELICLECGVHSHSILTAGGHREGEPVKENEVAATCLAEGSYVRIVRCSVCGEELSRETITIAKADHTPAEPEITNETEPTCTEEGGYEEIIVCSVCGEEISRNKITVEAKGHTPEEAIKEHEREATCTQAGSYEEVILCADCGEEISRRTINVAALGHEASAPVREQEVEATCTEPGHYNNVVYCSRCNEVMSSTVVNTAALGHSAAAAVKEQEVEASCERAGSYQSVVYCSRCNEEMSRSTVTTAALGHDYETVRENEEEATCESEGGYEEVKVCSRCGAELAGSRTHVTTAALGHNYEKVKQYETQTCTLIQCYDIWLCSRCGEADPDQTPPVAYEEPAPGHQWSLTPHGYTSCSVCGQSAIDAWLNGAYVVYSIDSTYMEAMGEAGNSFSAVQLVFVDTNSVINSGGYEGGYGSNIMIPDEYREPGGRLRVDFYFGNYYISSNIVTID